LLGHALEAIAASGPTGWSLRDLARRAGVSHAAPAHHFSDKTGLLTAVAIDGYRLLARELEASWAQTESALELGVAYVRFALANPAAFEVMYRPHLLHTGDPTLLEAQAAASKPLFVAMEHLATLDPTIDPTTASVAAWSIVHGFATLWLNGDLQGTAATDPEASIRAAAGYLFRPVGRTQPPL
jgi:AcrR family transcriptional regulator